MLKTPPIQRDAAKVELKPCPNPWCGRDLIIKFSVLNEDATAHVGMALQCAHCGVESPAAPTEDEAIDLWNQRDLRPDDALREAFAAMVSEDAIYLTGAENDQDKVAVFVTVAEVKCARAALNERNPKP